MPTLSQWALILLSCLLGGLALRQSPGPRRR
ncbi:IPTL-CTERM sorting domain-containing protein [Acidovorax sp. BLS4]|nr:IPTL-CTERM sorting domain-containing protein [Paracidovorax avenae]WOI48192.1 IPTL-CTERM sorting domain-containing protein [Paracidovorax avenae]